VLEIAIAVAATDPDATSSSKEQLQFMNQALKMGFTQEQFGAALAEVAGDGAAALGALLESSVAQIGDSATEARKPSMVLKDGMNLGGESEDTDPSSPDDSAPPAAPDATYHAPPGFQLTMVCSCFVGADQNRWVLGICYDLPPYLVPLLPTRGVCGASDALPLYLF